MDSSWYSSATVSLWILLKILSCYGASETMGAFNVEPRIHHGKPAETNDTRHMASIRRKDHDFKLFGHGHICGGSLITNSMVLSAAHCFYTRNQMSKIYEIIPAEKFAVVMGNLDRFQKTENTLTFNVARVVIDTKKFSLSTHEADLALVSLRGSVPENHPVIKPIQLNREILPGGTVCQTTGWGETEKSGPSDVLRTIDVPIIPREDCVSQTMYEDGDILDGMVCAGYLEGGRDTCTGDSGGPVVCDDVLGGVVSWGWDCGQPEKPGVYMNISFYVPWIEANLKGPGNGESSITVASRAPTCFRESIPLLSLLASLAVLLKNYLCN